MSKSTDRRTIYRVWIKLVFDGLRAFESDWQLLKGHPLRDAIITNCPARVIPLQQSQVISSRRLAGSRKHNTHAKIWIFDARLECGVEPSTPARCCATAQRHLAWCFFEGDKKWILQGENLLVGLWHFP
jgi:hypothetical protein